MESVAATLSVFCSEKIALMVRAVSLRLSGCVLLLAMLVLTAGCGISIHDAAANGEVALVAAMLDRDPALLESTNREGKAKGKTPLHYAVTYGREEVVALLLDRGAQVNAADATGLTPLHIAATLDRTGEAELLLSRGADIEARDAFGDTPLHLAAIFGQTRILPVLAEHGADLYARNDHDQTPVQAARYYRKERAVAVFEAMDLTDD